MMPCGAAMPREGGGEVVDWLPDAQVLAMLDLEPQGWVLARAVRQVGTIVDFQLVYINDAGCRLVGRPRTELVGRRYRQLWPETVHDGTLPFTGRWWRPAPRRCARSSTNDRPSAGISSSAWARTATGSWFAASTCAR